MLTRAHSGNGYGNLIGRVEVADHVLFASRGRTQWAVVVDGVIVDQFRNEFAALERIRRLAGEIRACTGTAEAVGAR